MTPLMKREEPETGAGHSSERFYSTRWFRVSALVLILTLFAFGVYQNYFLGDDCFISFRYARHLVAGEGLVWNPGERVEGYTNFLWVLLMAGSLLAGIPPETSSVAIGVTSGAGLLAVILRFSARQWGWPTSRKRSQAIFSRKSDRSCQQARKFSCFWP